MWKNIIQPDRPCALYAGYLKLQAHTQTGWYLLLLHDKVCSNTPEYYIMRTVIGSSESNPEYVDDI